MIYSLVSVLNARNVVSDSFRLLKMKPFSFIALLFYVASTVQAAQFAIGQQWLETQQTTQLHALSQLTPVAKPIKHVDLSADADKATLSGQQPELGFVSVFVSHHLLLWSSSVIRRYFSARAPPLFL